MYGSFRAKLEMVLWEIIRILKELMWTDVI